MLLCVASVLLPTGVVAAPTVITIGVLAFSGEESTADRWTPLAAYLSRNIPAFKFIIVPLTLDNIDTLVVSNKVDFLLTNPASYADMEASYGVTRLVTLRNLQPGGAYTQFGAVIFTRADRSDINTLEDLRGKSFAAAHPNAFGGWWMAWRELKARGIDPAENPGRLQFTGFPQDNIVYAVKNGSVDAGTVRTDVFELLAAKGSIDLREFRVLNPQTSDGFPLLRSTPLYPEWPLALVNREHTRLAQEVSIALLSMPADAPEARAASIAGWTVPLDYHAVHDLMRELQVGPYHDYSAITLRNLFIKYWRWLALGLVVLVVSLGISMYVLRLNRRLKHAARTLEVEVAQGSRAQRSSAAQAKRIRALYSVASMPGMSLDEEVAEVLRTGCVLLGLQIGEIVKIDIAQNRSEICNVHAPADFPLKQGDIIPLDRTYCIIPGLSKRPFAVDHAGKSRWRNLPCYEFSKMEAYIAAPIWVNEVFFGTICYASQQQRTTPFQETDMDLVQLMGRWIGVALERRSQQRELDHTRTQAETANRAKSDFLMRMSHELRTPLNAIIGYSEMLMEDGHARAELEQRRDLSKIHASGKQLLGLINDILDLSRIEAGKMELVDDAFLVRTVIDDVVATLQLAAAKNKNTIEVRCGDQVKEMTADATRLRQVLLNLMGNACKFTEYGRIVLEVEQRTERGRDWMVFTVADTGIGMTQLQINRLFEDFSQANTDTSRKYGGSGLGLAITKKFCTMMGGDIAVTSQPMLGSKFVLLIPINRHQVQDVFARVKNSAA